MKIKTTKINFKSKSFIKKLKQIKKENDKIDEDSEIDILNLFRKFNV